MELPSNLECQAEIGNGKSVFLAELCSFLQQSSGEKKDSGSVGSSLGVMSKLNTAEGRRSKKLKMSSNDKKDHEIC